MKRLAILAAGMVLVCGAAAAQECVDEVQSLAGELGVMVFDGLVRRELLHAQGRDVALTTAGAGLSGRIAAQEQGPMGKPFVQVPANVSPVARKYLETLPDPATLPAWRPKRPHRAIRTQKYSRFNGWSIQ